MRLSVSDSAVSSSMRRAQRLDNSWTSGLFIRVRACAGGRWRPIGGPLWYAARGSRTPGTSGRESFCGRRCRCSADRCHRADPMTPDGRPLHERRQMHRHRWPVHCFVQTAGDGEHRIANDLAFHAFDVHPVEQHVVRVGHLGSRIGHIARHAISRRQKNEAMNVLE